MPTTSTDPLRVIFLTHNYPRSRDDIAGGFLRPLAMALRDRGVDLRVVAPSDHGAGGRDLIDGIPVRRVRYASPSRERYAYTGTMADAARTPAGLVALWRMIGALRQGVIEEADGAERVVVHAHWWIPGAMAAPHGLAMVCTCHGTDVRLLERSGIARWLARRALGRARLVTTVSTPFAGIIRSRLGVPVQPDAVQPMPVAATDRPRSVGGGGVIVLGRLTPQKRTGLAIDAWQLARDNGLALPLTIIGDGPERPMLERHAASVAGAGTVRFVGTVAPEQVPGFLATADVMLMTAHDEGFGLAAAEALMQGVPVVACTDGGGLLDIVPDSGGGRRAAPTAAAIASALGEMAADRSAADAAHAAGAVWRERLAPGYVATRAIEWYRQALDG